MTMFCLRMVGLLVGSLVYLSVYLLVNYLMMLSVAKLIFLWLVELLVNNELERMWKWSLPNLNIYYGICVEGLNETRRTPVKIASVLRTTTDTYMPYTVITIWNVKCKSNFVQFGIECTYGQLYVYIYKGVQLKSKL